jgi:hypothetical protein
MRWIMEARGNFKELEIALERLLELSRDRMPQWLAQSYLDLSELYSTCPEDRFRDGKRALDYAQKAGEMYKWKYPVCFQALAAAYAENGDFDSAVLCQFAAVDLAPQASKNDYHTRLELYAKGKPYRRPSLDRELDAPTAPSPVADVPPFDK